MRIAGNTTRRNFLRNYEMNSTSKFESEQKISTGRQFQRASENPINAAKALRVRKSMADLATHQKNLESADSIYQVAEDSLLTVSSLIQNTYEKLVQGAHGTYNRNDMEIIAAEIEQYAQEMVQMMNVDVADRKIFGGVNNETNAFEIHGPIGSQYVTYNGISVNADSDPLSYPNSEVSFLDIGIGMSVDGFTNRIDDQTALPITFNGVGCTGCGVTQRTVKIDLQSVFPGEAYKLEVSVGSNKQIVEFNGGDTTEDTINNINEALSEQFMVTPQIDTTGDILYIENMEGYEETLLCPYENEKITDNTVDLAAMERVKYYSLEVTSNGMTRVIDFEGADDVNLTITNIREQLDKQFGEYAPKIFSAGKFLDANGGVCDVANTSDYSNSASVISGDSINYAAAKPGQTYSFNLNGTQVTFTCGASAEQDADSQLEYTEHGGYSKNIMQLVLDAAGYLREGDQDMVARYADLIYAAQAPLSVAIADLGTNDQFIEFNETRIENTLLNLSDKQNDLEITDLPTEITNYKVLETIYNATLQMGAQMIPMSIFNYIN